MRPVGNDMGVKIAITIVVYILVAVGLSLHFWDCLSEEESFSSALRNLVLTWGTPLAIFLAVWRSIVAQQQAETAQRQAEIAQKGLLSARYQQAVEMLGHDEPPLRFNAIYVLENIALENRDEYEDQVTNLLRAYQEPPKPDDLWSTRIQDRLDQALSKLEYGSPIAHQLTKK